MPSRLNSLNGVRLSQTVCFTLAIIWTLSRLIYLSHSPPGFYFDEAAGVLNMICLHQHGLAFDGTPHPLFPASIPGTGMYTPIYSYAGLIWGSLFGFSPTSLRSFCAVFGVLTLVGIFFLARTIARKENLFDRTESKTYAWLALLLAALSPWLFQFARIAWDPAIMPCFLVWGLYFLLQDGDSLTPYLSGIGFAAAMYSYPPTRVQIPLLISLLLLVPTFRKWVSVRSVMKAVITLSIISVPLLNLVFFSPKGMSRYNTVGLFTPSYLYYYAHGSHLTVFFHLLRNIVVHFDPRYLFLSGDGNLRHSIQSVGEWSPLDIFGLGSLIYLVIRNPHSLRHVKVSIFLFACYLLGVLPSAMTWEALPHALRSLGAAPFLSILGALWIYEVLRLHPRVWHALALVSVVYSVFFAYSYFEKYPQISPQWFDVDAANQAELAQSSGDWKWDQTTSPDQTVLKRYYYSALAGGDCFPPLLHSK